MVHPIAGAGDPRVLIGNVILVAVQVLVWIMIIDALLTFIPTLDRRHPIVRLLRSITEPIYRPLRNVIPPVRFGDAALDLSPLIAIIGIQLIASLIVRIIVR